MLIETDRQIGRLLAGLRSAGVASTTLVLFLSDNGPLPPFNDLSRDPNETQNVLAAHRDVADQLAKNALKWRQSLPVLP